MVTNNYNGYGHFRATGMPCFVADMLTAQGAGIVVYNVYPGVGIEPFSQGVVHYDYVELRSK